MARDNAVAPVSAFYKDLLSEIKHRVRKAQNHLATAANVELLALYWDVGGLLIDRQKKEGWGAGVLRRLGTDLKNELSGRQGFSERNLKLMTQFYREYPELFANGQQAVAGTCALVRTLSWSVNILLIQKVKDLNIRKWYMHAAIEQGWGHDILGLMIKSNAHERQGAVINNFEACLPASHSKRVKELLKDPYIFDFLTLDKPFRERELEASLILCQDKKRVLAEYALRGMNNPIGISEYELTRALPDKFKSVLPSIEEIEAELSGNLQDRSARKIGNRKRKQENP